MNQNMTILMFSCSKNVNRVLTDDRISHALEKMKKKNKKSLNKTKKIFVQEKLLKALEQE